MSEPFQLDTLIAAAPQIVEFVGATAQALGAGFGQAPTAELKKEILEALIEGEEVLEALRLIPDLDESQFRPVLEALLNQIVPEQGA